MIEADSYVASIENLHGKINEVRLHVAAGCDKLFANPDNVSFNFERDAGDWPVYLPSIADNFAVLQDSILTKVRVNEDPVYCYNGKLLEADLSFMNPDRDFSHIHLRYFRNGSRMESTIAQKSGLIIGSKEESRGDLKDLMRVSMVKDIVDFALLLDRASKVIATSSAKN